MTTPIESERTITAIVFALRTRPSEWISFRRLAALLNMPGIDGDVVGALVDYRPDIFAVSKDRKVKLRMTTVEEISLRGKTEWKLPEVPQKKSPNPISSRGTTAGDHVVVGCYCDLPSDAILEDLKNANIPEEALVNSCCWRRICSVRGSNLWAIPEDIWREICERRGYLYFRQNPRGF
jgi:hypothetical protein